MKYEIELVHFQIERDCNLRCWFCGQWGRKGFFSDARKEDLKRTSKPLIDAASQPQPGIGRDIKMKYEDWERVVVQLADYRDESGISPDILLWGGEPLLCPFFEKLVRLLKANGFRLGIVTNGTLIDRYAALLGQEFHHIYVSIDGNREVHDKIRGKGVYEKVTHNLQLIYGGNAKVSIMTVISLDTLPVLRKLPDLFGTLACDEVLLQEMIVLTGQEAADYKGWMKECFGVEASEIDSWVGEAVDEKKKEEALREILASSYPKPVQYLPHVAGNPPCKSPFSHIHIAWNGEVLYCTDFYDFTAGNVKREPLMEIFRNEKSEKFRREIQKGRCAACRHCSWKNSEGFYL